MRAMVERLGLASTRIAALGMTALAVCFSAYAAEPREVHIDVGSSSAPLIATVHVDDYRAAPFDLLTPVAAGDPSMTRLLKTYFQSGRAGDTKTFASLYEPHLRADVNDHYPTSQLLREQFEHLRSVRGSAVLHWGEYQFGAIEYEAAVDGGTRRWTGSHSARCVDTKCEMANHYENDQLGRFVSGAFADKGAAQVVTTEQAETLLPILPAADAGQKAVATHPVVLHLKGSADSTMRVATALASALSDKVRATKQSSFEPLAVLYSAGIPTRVDVFKGGNEVPAYEYGAYVTWFASHAPWTVSSVYALGPEVCVALLQSEKDRALHLLPLQRAGDGWKIISDPSRLDAWLILSSISTYQALRR